jgi:hypothetical protein
MLVLLVVVNGCRRLREHLRSIQAETTAMHHAGAARKLYTRLDRAPRSLGTYCLPWVVVSAFRVGACLNVDQCSKSEGSRPKRAPPR